jgi:hypothetical protein
VRALLEDGKAELNIGHFPSVLTFRHHYSLPLLR